LSKATLIKKGKKKDLEVKFEKATIIFA